MRAKRLAALALVTVFFLPSVLLAAGGNGNGTGEKLLSWGVDHRFRSVFYDNIINYNDDLDDDRDFFRFRTRLWADVPLSKNITFFFQLNNEFRKYTTPDLEVDLDEIIVENFYVDFQKMFGSHFSLRVGRQNLMRGEGFVLFDGNALDGSRTAYFNAVNLAYDFGKAKLELLGIHNPYQDRFFPRINDKQKPLTEWDEQALGAYYTDHHLAQTTVETYYFYKKEFNCMYAPTHAQYQPERRLHTIGGRVTHLLRKDWTLTGEFAGQWGQEHPDRDMTGWAGYAHVKKTFAHDWKPYVKFGLTAFSGDDPDTAEWEGWDPLFSRWPKWSELYIYSFVPEKGVAYWSNATWWQAEVGVSPLKELSARATYYYVGAFHDFPGTPSIYGGGTRRGSNFQVRLDYSFSKYIKGHLLYESFMPGDFYSAQDMGYFLRFELCLQYKDIIKPW